MEGLFVLIALALWGLLSNASKALDRADELKLIMRVKTHLDEFFASHPELETQPEVLSTFQALVAENEFTGSEADVPSFLEDTYIEAVRTFLKEKPTCPTISQ